MKHILLLGAGRSTIYLIEYLAAYVAANDARLTICDITTEHLREKWGQQPTITLLDIDIHSTEQLYGRINQANLVISLLPAVFHLRIADFCLALQKDFLSASYVSKEMKVLHDSAQQDGLLFLMEMGLDPGLDHMSAMAALTTLKTRGGTLLSFKSYTGGLLSPESDNNPWHYKIAWNPRNIVVSGQGIAKYLENGQPKYVPYQQLFRHTETIQIDNIGPLEGYPNRDSLIYRELYNIPDIPTILRGTLRHPGFCSAWQALVQLGLTDDSYTIAQSALYTYRQWFESYLPANGVGQTLENRLAKYLGIPADSPDWERLRYLDLWADEPIGLINATPAQILEKRLVEKLKLNPEDKDVVVMQHLFEYTLGTEHRCLKTSLVVKGQDSVHTAMAKCVGLPVAIGAKMMLEKKIHLIGVQIPNAAEIYAPILAELKEYGIHFIEEDEVIGKVMAQR